MKRLIRNYLASLKEDGELDKICVEMLEDLGLVVNSVPQKGTRQYGVDILAHGKMPGDDEEKTYALIVKAKNIDRTKFEASDTGVSASIKECVNVYAANFLPTECQCLPLVICIVCGGDILFEVRQNLNSCIETEIEWARAKKGRCIKMEEWNGAFLADMLVNSLGNPNILATKDRKLISRCIALANDPETAFKTFKTFADHIVEEKGGSDDAQIKSLHVLNMTVAMLFEECKSADVNNREAAWCAAEYAYLKEWAFIQKVRQGKKVGKRFEIVLKDISRLYASIADSYIDRISIYVKERYGFSLAVDGSDEVDVIISFYDVLGKLSSYGLYLITQHKQRKDDCSQPEAGDILVARLKKIVSAIVSMLLNNSASAMPILDSQSMAIAMTFLFLSQVGHVKELAWWIRILADGVFAAFKQGYGYLVATLEYKDLLEHMHVKMPNKEIADLLKASELIPVLALSAIRNGCDDAYETICELVRYLPAGTNYQMWFLDNDSEKEFYSGNTLCGSQLCSLDVIDKKHFVEILETESKVSPIALSCCGTKHEGLLYIGCRHYGFPLPGNCLCQIGR